MDLCWQNDVCFLIHCLGLRASLEDQTVKNLPAMQETWIWSLGKEDPLEKGMATHSSIIAWEIPRTEEPGHSQTWLNYLHFHLH